MNVPYWDFLGSTMVTNNYVRLVWTKFWLMWPFS